MRSQHTEELDAPPRPGGEPDKEGRAPVVHKMHYSRGVPPEVGAVHLSFPKKKLPAESPGFIASARKVGTDHSES